ncbi:MAG: hypothetical protein IMX04_04915 [Candidatus Carbobacillus altaicus]|nr:hypothetical protein [Candidatus Carbobacillus altaicus]
MKNSIIFEYINTREKYDNNFRKSIQNMYAKNARFSGFLIRLIVSLLAFFVKPKPGSIKYFFWGNKYTEIITSLSKSEVCVIGGPKQLLFCLKHRIKFIPCMRMWDVLLLSIVNNMEDNTGKLDKLIGNLSSKIDKFKSYKSVLVVDNDSLPMQRSVITAARQANLDEIICIQDGLFQSKSPKEFFHGWFSDRFFVINEIQKQLLIDKGMDEKKIHVMGFHKSTYKPKRPLSKANDRKVCFLGQPWLKYGDKQGLRYLEIVASLSDSLRELGYLIYYKPHPWENQLALLDNKFDGVYKGSLENAIEEYDVFISITSTALLEVAASGRIAIQVYDDVFDCDDMSIYPNIYTVYFASKNFSNDLMYLIIKENENDDIEMGQSVIERFRKGLE